MSETQIHQYKDDSVKKYPYLSFSENLIDYFLIIGYDQQEIKKEIIPEIIRTIQRTYPKSQKRPAELIDQNKIQKLKSLIKPTILNCVSSDTKLPIPEEELILDLIFPSLPTMYYCSENIMNYEICQRSIVFYFNPDIQINQEEKSDEPEKLPQHGYAYIFFESLVKEGLRVFIPRTFCFISQYPLFTVFHSLSKELIKLFLEKNNNEVPIEVIIYNIVNFIPSPFYHPLSLNLFPNKSLNNYTMNIAIPLNDNQSIHISRSSVNTSAMSVNSEHPHIKRKYSLSPRNNNSILIEQLSGYPIFNFNFSEIFKILSSESLIEIFLLSFIEQDIIFISKNLEAMNIIMYAIACLSYPLSDTAYLWHILSLSKDMFCQKEDTKNIYIRRFVNNPWTSIRGVNSTYDTEIDEYIGLNGKFVVDLDNKRNFYKLGAKDTVSEKKLIEFIEFERKIMKRKTVESSYIANCISDLYNKIDVAYKRFLFNNKTYNNKDEMLFKFFNVDKSIISNNRSLQEEFYKFILNIMQIVYSTYSLKTIQELINMAQKNTNIKIEKFEGKKYVIFSHTNYQNLIQEDRYFLHFFKETGKFSKYFINFLQLNKTGVLYQIPYSFTEEFLSLKLIEKTKMNIKYFEIFDNFYNKKFLQTDNLYYDINFDNFYFHYQNNLKEYFFTLIKSSSNIKRKTQKVAGLEGKIKKYIYEYQSIELCQEILSHYASYISNLNDNILYEIFPSYMVQKGITVSKIKSKEISNHLENSLIFYNKGFDYLILSTFQMFGITSEYSKYHILLIPMLEKISSSKVLYRKYIALLISIYYRLAEKKINNCDQTASFEVMLYASLLNILRISKIIPTKEILFLVENFDIIKEKLANMKTDNRYSLSSEKQLIQDSHYQLGLKDNKCKCKKVERGLKFFIQLAENLESEVLLEFTCEECGKVIKPKIILSSKKISKVFYAEFYSPLYLLRSIWKIMEIFNIDLNKDRINQALLNEVLVNLICYLNHRGRIENSISNFFYKFLLSQ